MLVLTRRPSEKILFPGLGISVEVLNAKNGAVRLGIDAPEEVDVVRSEIAERFTEKTKLGKTRLGKTNATVAAYPSAKPTSDSGVAATSNFTRYQAKQIQRQFDAANLAIHLAQNQLVQGLQHNADEALEQALDCLKQLEDTLQLSQGGPQAQSLVKEPNNGYSVDEKSEPTVLILHPADGRDGERGARQPWTKAVDQLEKEGFEVEFANDISEAIEYLLRREYPIALFSITVQPEISFDSLGRFLACRGKLTPAIDVDREFETFGSGTGAYAGVFANAECAARFREATLVVD